jgi:hypothetical protein
MYKKLLISLLIITFMVMMAVSFALAWPPGKPVTPYGDFCDQCTKYGTCKSIMTHEAAKKAMLNYYHKKGFRVELVKKRGRFIRAKVKEKEKGKVVDVIIFDRRTGRIRSIY